jgi:prepilin-type N-terminal cleavage/methylation domain-containing protein
VRQGRDHAQTFAPHSASGFTLIEVLVALLLVALGLLSAAPMFMYGVKVSAASADVGTLASGAVKQLESLRQLEFSTLPVGGGLVPNTPIAGFSDVTNPEYTLQWRIASVGTKKKTIEIIAFAKRTTTMGYQRSVSFMTLRAA